MEVEALVEVEAVALEAVVVEGDGGSDPIPYHTHRTVNIGQLTFGDPRVTPESYLHKLTVMGPLWSIARFRCYQDSHNFRQDSAYAQCPHR